MSVTPYQKLYLNTDELVRRFKPSLTSYFSVFIDGSFGNVNNDTINFLAYEAVLPGTSYQTTEVFGDRQGIRETFANQRVYPAVDISFYVDYDYDVLHFFEQWIATTSPNSGVSGESYNRFQYPNLYKKEVKIIKFERDLKNSQDRLQSGGVTKEPKQAIYTLLNAYPTNLISLPVSYEQSNILRTTVTFNYDLYSYEQKLPTSRGTKFNNQPATGNVRGPGGDSTTPASSTERYEVFGGRRYSVLPNGTLTFPRDGRTQP